MEAKLSQPLAQPGSDSCAGSGWFCSCTRGSRSFCRAFVGFWVCSSTSLGKKKPQELSWPMEGPPRFPHVPLPAVQPGALAASLGGVCPQNVDERLKLLGKRDVKSASGSNSGTGRTMGAWVWVPLSPFLAKPAANFSVCFAPATRPCRSASGCQRSSLIAVAQGIISFPPQLFISAVGHC